MTGNDLIASSLRLIGVLASGENPPSNESNDALNSLNDMINSWTNERLMIYETSYETFTLNVNQQSYQWGTGAADFNSPRPQKLENVNWQQVSATTTLELGVEILNKDQWSAISIKGITSNIPTRCWLENTYPNATFFVWPIPSVSGSVVIWSWKPLITVSSLTTTISLPPGYAKALRYNLAVELAPEYGKTPSDLVMKGAMDSKSAIKSMNDKILLMSCDLATLNRRSTFNWYTGE